MKRLARIAWLSVLVAGCGGGSGDEDGGTMDGASPSECEGQPDGTSCASGAGTCQGEVCQTGSGECGDGVVDSGEACDDGNTTAFDGCEPDCSFTCEADTECDDGRVCNGAETCGASSHVCEPGTPADDGTTCSTPEITDGVCVTTPTGPTCVGAGCGNGVLDGSEQCDDMNDVAADGCEADCTFSCEADADCDDGMFCSGVETCDTTTHVCQPGTSPDCSDGDDCTDDVCDELTATCLNPLIDMDMDGHAPDTLGACGDDCDDTRADVFTGAEELCDTVDNNCNGDTDEVAPEWYVDCDADGFAASTDSSRMGCEEPPGSATGCGGGWTSRRPINPSTTDCDDGDVDAFPGQTMYFTSAQTSGSNDDERYGNYNCDGTAQRDHTTAAGQDGTCSLRVSGLFGSYRASCTGTGWTGSTAPSCGGSGTYVSCGSPRECTSSSCPGYSLVCVGSTSDSRDPCYCPRGMICLPSCTPGSRDCPWHYYRCDATTDAGVRMACH
ncbi:MAG: hypothetical protein KC619_08925 [Myxococcales bacterium]|nr:hypothetical protein [Myxococcales bacterium]